MDLGVAQLGGLLEQGLERRRLLLFEQLAERAFGRCRLGRTFAK